MSKFLSVRLLGFPAVLLAAFLTFMAQPLMGKYLVPWHGGSASTWVTAMVFFQAALLAGYALAYLLQRVSVARQAYVVAGLALLVPFITQIPPMQIGSAISAWGVLTSLTVSLFPAILLTTCLGILLHGWFRFIGSEVPYYLYSISNVGSLLALCAYPLLIEPRIGLERQSSAFQALLFLLCALSLGLAYLMWRQARGNGTEVMPQPEIATASTGNEVISSVRKLYWLVLSAAACAAMIGTMRALSAEIGSNPLSWILPLAIYLLSFSITFSGIWRPFFSPLLTAAFAAVLFPWLFYRGLQSEELSFQMMGLAALVLFCATHLAHGLVYLSRPKIRFDLFYVVIAAGGVLGGFFASISAPSFFSQPYEFSAALLIILGVGAWQLFQGMTLNGIGWIPRLSAALGVLVPGVIVLIDQVTSQNTEKSTETHFRNIYGHFRINVTPHYLVALSETTIHGAQWRDPSRRGLATTYYHPGSGIGRMMVSLQTAKPNLKVGVLGLGVGTLAAYGRESDKLVFWDIDPSSFTIAGTVFSFVSDSAADVEFHHQDGRLGIEGNDEKFDLVIVDAFSGDSVPPHLLTREAIESYLKSAPNGVLAIHASNRYINLFPVLATHAKDLNLDARWVIAGPGQKSADQEAALVSNYFFFFPEAGMIDVAQFEEILKEPYLDFTYKVIAAESLEPSKEIRWTDDRHAILDVFPKFW